MKSPPHPRGKPIPVVGLGASAGGLDPLKVFFRHCPGDAGPAYVVLQHLPPSGVSALADILDDCTAMPVRPIKDGMAPESNHVYVMAPNQEVTIRDGAFHVQALSDPHPNQTISRFFESLAGHAGDCGIGIVLSGSGTDGAEGCKSIRERGGLVIVQDPEEAQFDGMPNATIHTGTADYILRVREMPERVFDYVHHAPQFHGHRAAGESQTTETLRKIIQRLARSHTDFSRYKEKTIIRRIYRRMGMNHISDPERYLALLSSKPEEADLLYQALLISVTSFFRDREAMAALDHKVIDALATAAAPDREIRIWVAGCATGEEAYSLAILLNERLESTGKPARIQIFATDLDERALAIARAGLYPAAIEERVSRARLARYFTREGDYYRVAKTIREQIVFATQNLISNPPFSGMDLITCRNLLIYLKLEVQNRVMDLFHFSLREDGFLFLGSSETIGRKNDLFRPVDRRHRIYRRNAAYRRSLFGLSAGPGVNPVQKQSSPVPAPSSAAAQRPRFGDRVQRHLLTQYAPPAVLATVEGEALYFVGDTSAYLKHPTGEPSRQLFDLARGTVKSTLRKLLRQAAESGRAQSGTVRAGHGKAFRKVTLAVSPLGFGVDADTHYLVTFEQLADESPGAGATSPADPPAGAESGESESAEPTESTLVRQLEDELHALRGELQNTLEDRESSNQDLKASHEEAMSMNEELQSTNEELETSKEELQSLNEEMNTVNGELQSKVDQLDQAYGDLDNLIKSIGAATLFIDPEFHIRLFTPNCRHLFNLRQSDIGRPLEDIKPKVDDPRLFEDARKVLDTLRATETEAGAEGDNGEARYYLRRIAPYRAAADVIDGVVITYTDITRLKNAERELTAAAEELEERVRERTSELEEHMEAREKATRERDAFFELSSSPFFIAGENDTFTRLNPAWEKLFGWPLAELRQQPFPSFIHPDDAEAFSRRLKQLPKDQECDAFSARFRGRDGGYRWLEWDIRRDVHGLLFGAARDVSEQVRMNQALSHSRRELEKSFDLRTEQLRIEKKRASSDDLTGLVNRGEFEERLRHAIAGAHENAKTHALLFMDLDRFKIVNDTCGHEAGDELLRQIARGLQTHVRQRDTLARLGGDEFALIVENCNTEQAVQIANGILGFMRDFHFIWDDKSFHLGISIGIALIDEQVPSSLQVVHNADNACYIAKEAGRDRVHVFNESRSDDQDRSTYMYWVSRVALALEADHIELMAQPIVSLADGAHRGNHFEVLARLQDDDGQLISPASFIDAAERYNLMPRLDRYVVEKVFKWLAETPSLIEELDICAINLSANTLGDDRFPAFLEQLVDRYRIPTHKICFEITETMAIRNLSKTIELAEEFKSLGFLFALDDFGSGFASFHYLKRLPVDFLKIDGEFVRDMLVDPVDEAMVRSMNEIGHIMGKKTIAEFVESPAILEKLREMGVDYGQGYGIARPELLIHQFDRHSLPETGK